MADAEERANLSDEELAAQRDDQPLVDREPSVEATGPSDPGDQAGNNGSEGTPDPAGPDPDDSLSDASLDDNDDEARERVEDEREELREFVKSLSSDDIKSGNWFTKLLAHSLRSYSEKVDWKYFQDRYKGVPADAIVDQRIKMAARYAAVEGTLSAGAYTVAIAATIGSGGGASPATVPAALATVMVDVTYLSRLQMRLAYDIAVLYRVPMDLSDPEDLWKLIRVAFTIKSGEFAREGALKVVPTLVRPLVKRFYSGPVLVAVKSLPIVGKYLLQRNVIKIGIPLVGVPLATLLNRYTTRVTGRHARSVFRNEARVREVAKVLSDRTEHPRLLLWLAWFMVMADKRISDDEALLMRHLVRHVGVDHQVVDEELAQIIEFKPADLWRRVESEPGDLGDIVDAAKQVATVDGEMNKAERQLFEELDQRCAPAQSPTSDPEINGEDS